MENNNLKKAFCPVLGREIDGLDCFDAALVFEGMSPLSELPKAMSLTDKNKEICLKCKYHPE